MRSIQVRPRARSQFAGAGIGGFHIQGGVMIPLVASLVPEGRRPAGLGQRTPSFLAPRDPTRPPRPQPGWRDVFDESTPGRS